MPRDLQSLKEDSLSGNVPSPGTTASPSPMSQEDENSMINKISETHGKSKRDELHPYTQCLTVNDVESCTKLEEATFPPEERCTKEKVSCSVPPSLSVSLGHSSMARQDVVVCTMLPHLRPLVSSLCDLLAGLRALSCLHR